MFFLLNKKIVENLQLFATFDKFKLTSTNLKKMPQYNKIIIKKKQLKKYLFFNLKKPIKKTLNSSFVF